MEVAIVKVQTKNEKGRRRAMRGKISAVLILVLLSTFAPVVCYPSDVTTVKGGIESVTGDAMSVNGRYYYFSDVPLVDPSGRKVPATELQVGRKVEIFFQQGREKSIVVYEEKMLE
jgi:hypothetical protein